MRRVDDKPGEKPAPGYGAIELQTTFSQRVPPQQPNIREFNAVVLGGWFYRSSLQKIER